MSQNNLSTDLGTSSTPPTETSESVVSENIPKENTSQRENQCLDSTTKDASSEALADPCLPSSDLVQDTDSSAVDVSDVHLSLAEDKSEDTFVTQPADETSSPSDSEYESAEEHDLVQPPPKVEDKVEHPSSVVENPALETENPQSVPENLESGSENPESILEYPESVPENPQSVPENPLSSPENHESVSENTPTTENHPLSSENPLPITENCESNECNKVENTENVIPEDIPLPECDFEDAADPINTKEETFESVTDTNDTEQLADLTNNTEKTLESEISTADSTLPSECSTSVNQSNNSTTTESGNSLPSEPTTDTVDNSSSGKCIDNSEPNSTLPDIVKNLSSQNQIGEKSEHLDTPTPEQNTDTSLSEPLVSQEITQKTENTQLLNETVPEQTIINDPAQETCTEVPSTDFDDIPLPASKGYNLDFLDNLDDSSFNPFASKTAIRNTPPPSPPPGLKLPPLKPIGKKKVNKKDKSSEGGSAERKTEKNLNDEDFSQSGSSRIAQKQSENDSIASVKELDNNSNTKVDISDSSEGTSKDKLHNSEDIVLAKNVNDFPTDAIDGNDSTDQILEIKFDDKPIKKPPKNLGKKPVLKSRTKTKHPPKLTKEPSLNTINNNKTENNNDFNAQNSNEIINQEEEDIPIVPKKSYDLSFLDNLDDPNFNPFASKADIRNSPPKEGFTKEPLEKPILNKAKKVNAKPVNVRKGFSVIKNQQNKSDSTESKENLSSENQEVPDSVDSNKEQVVSLKENTDSDIHIEKELSQESSSLSDTDLTQVPEKVVTANLKLYDCTPPPEESETQLDSNNQVGSPDYSEPYSSTSSKELFSEQDPQTTPEQLCQEQPSSLEPLSSLTSSSPEATSINSAETVEIKDSLPNVPSINSISKLDSLEFEELLTNEASRLAEELMNFSTYSTDSGLAELDETNISKATNMSDIQDFGGDSQDPFRRKSKISRSPPLHKRMVDGGENEPVISSEDTTGDICDFDEEPGRCDLENEANHSEAGPEIATGLTDTDLQCASQFFKEVLTKDNANLRKNLLAPFGTQHRFSTGDLPADSPEKDPIAPERRKRSNTSPPKEERSAPEGTSSPTPARPSEASSKPRPVSAPDGYMTNQQVEELLKQQEKQFEEKLQRVGKLAAEKEKKVRESMKEEQKELEDVRSSMGELTTSRDALLKMVQQYKTMLSTLVADKEKDKNGHEEKIKKIEVERDQALEDLANVEQAFSDVHRKYERTKQVVDTLKRNEETLRKAVTDYESKLQNQEARFVEFQKSAEDKVQQANEEFEILRKSNEQEMTKMAALLKKAEMKIISLQEGLDRKTKENQELTQLCDDLINKMGPS